MTPAQRPIRILVVDDEADFAKGLVRLISSHLSKTPHVQVSCAFSGEEALGRLAAAPTQLMLTDLRMPVMNGLQLLERALAIHPDLTVIMLTAHGSIELAVGALKAGAYDFLTKPITPEELFRVVDKALERGNLLAENAALRGLVAVSTSPIIGKSPAMEQLKRTVAAVAQSNYTVLVRGESGTGKELVSRMVHDVSSRAHGPFVPVNCPAIPDELLESELFGHVKGAFTGADADRPGLLHEATGGSIHLDEIGDISQAMQAKILRFLQEGETRPVGGNKSRPVDVRVIASTNKDLEAKVADKSFREDLYYRLNVLSVHVPALRDRREDIPLLARFFLSQTCREMNLPDKAMSPGAMGRLSELDWPGNVRELQNTVRRLAVFSSGEVVDEQALAFVEQGAVPEEAGALVSYKDSKAAAIERFTLGYVVELLRSTRGNISEAARLSGLTRVALQKIMQRYDIQADADKS